MIGKDTSNYDRRTVLRAAGGLAGAALAAGSAAPAAAQDGPDFGGWFDDVDNFDGVVDRTGQSEVTVTVGAEGNGGAFAFAPAAVRVDPGTTVLFEWTGEGGAHNVVGEGNEMDSGDAVDATGVQYEYTFESEGVYKYFCEPHRTLGMKGAVVVGSAGGGGGDTGSGGGGDTGGGGGRPDYGGWFSDVGNFDGATVDATGQSEVTVTVGAEGNGGAFAFDPPAVHVDPGTTVLFEWTGEGGAHNVVGEGNEMDSGDAVDATGVQYEYTFEEDGIYKYFCEPHLSLGMKGAVVVGTDYPTTGGGDGGADGGGGGIGYTLPGDEFGSVFMPIVFALTGGAGLAVLAAEAYGSFRRSRRTAAEREPVEYTEEAPVEEPTEEIAHDEYDPVGTAGLVVAYLVIVVLLWLFMYFVEFLGGGPTVIG